jgi:hypothetical protein
MLKAKWCCENISSGNFDFKSVMGEVKELIEARSLDDIKEEFGDVLYFTYCWLYSTFGINLPMIGAMGSAEKFGDRLGFWIATFEYHNLEFDPKYLINGSNYERPEKIKLALDMARKEQGK